MGFWNGRVTFTRYQVGGESPLPFGEEIIEQARARLIGHNNSADPSDGVGTGWAGGEHVLDVTLDAAKNIVDDGLHMSIRIDTDKIPASLLRAYTQIEIDAVAQLNPSGVATKGQRQDAKEAARKRAEAEAADGRFRRLNHVPILWDGRANILYAGSTSSNVLERLQALFRETFDRSLEPLTSGSLADHLAARGHSDAERPGGKLDARRLALVTESGGPECVFAWSDDSPSAMDYLGNEFMLWIWHTLQNDGDTIALGDGSEVTVMLTKTLTLDCPRGETGRDQLTDDAPYRLPEAFRALQAGKLPRKAGMILVRQGAQFELTLQAESLAVSGAALPKPEEKPSSQFEARIARLERLRHLSDTLDLLFETYLTRRTSSNWNDELGRIRRWLQAA
jgi:hypothetical protein